MLKILSIFTLSIISLTLILLFYREHRPSEIIGEIRADFGNETMRLQNSIGWERMQIPDNFFPSSVAFGEKGEIALIGNDIRFSKDNGKTWKIIRSGKGYDRCTLDGGKTFDDKCAKQNKNPSIIKVDGDVNYNGDVRNPVINSGRLYLSTFYEHHGALWSIPLENPKELWFGLHFTYYGEPDDMKYWTTDDFITLRNKVFVSANSRVDEDFNWLITEDEGKTWRKAKINLSADKIFADQNTGIRVSDNQIEKTTNGGISWRILQSPKTPDSTFSDDFIDDKIGFACGENGMLAITKDGGKTWRDIDLGIRDTFYVVAALDKNNAWAAGDKGYIFETADGGETWQPIDLGFEKNIYSGFYGKEIGIDEFHRTVWIIKDDQIWRKKIPLN